MPDFERPEKVPSFSGIVKSIVGNEVTILKIEGIQGDKEDNAKNSKKTSRSDFGGNRMGIMGGGRNTGTRISDDSERLAMLKSLSTGEEKVIIPIGIKMLKNEDEKMIEASLDDVVKDKMLIIWIDESISNKNVANFVLIK